MNKDAVLTVRVPSSLKEALQRAAADDMRTLASLVGKILADYAKAQGLLDRKTKASTKKGKG